MRRSTFRSIGLSPGWLRSDDSPFDRLSNRRGAAVHSEFLEDINDMGPGGTLFDVEVLGDLFVGRSFGHQLQNVKLPWSERSFRGLSAGELEGVVGGPVGHLGLYERSTPISF